MFEDESITSVSFLFIAVCFLYIFGSITVGIISKKNNLSFQLGFIWSIVFTPLVGLYLVLKNDPSKKPKFK
jgi:lipopolysaccharide export LptBFGC system permease protein LptF